MRSTQLLGALRAEGVATYFVTAWHLARAFQGPLTPLGAHTTDPVRFWLLRTAYFFIRPAFASGPGPYLLVSWLDANLRGTATSDGFRLALVLWCSYYSSELRCERRSLY